MLYVTDTHALAWYILGKLPERVDTIFKSTERGESTVFIPTIVLAECLYLVENEKIELDFDELLRKIETSRNFVPTSFNLQVMKFLAEINLKELHDRIIVANSKDSGCQAYYKGKG
jgi:predicted nucleic acid-binding protein